MSLCARFTFDDFILSRGKNSFLDRISNRRHVGQETMADEQKAYAQQVRFEFIRQTDGDETMKFRKVVPSPNTARYLIVPRSANCNRSIHGWASVDLELEKGLLVDSYQLNCGNDCDLTFALEKAKILLSSRVFEIRSDQVRIRGSAEDA